MMNQKWNHLNLFLVFLFLSNLISAQVTKQDIDKIIDFSSLKHSYLYFSEEDKPELLFRIQNNQECNDFYRKLEAEAQIWLFMPVDKNIPVQGKNTRAGWTDYDTDGKYSKYFNTTRNNAFYLAFLYQMTGEHKYADKAFNFANRKGEFTFKL